MSQNKKILGALMEGRHITPIHALNEFGCFRLAARVHDLRGQGFNIQSDDVDGHAVYWINLEDRQKKSPGG